MKKTEMKIEFCWLPIFRDVKFNKVEESMNGILLFSQEGWELKAAVPIHAEGRTLGIMHYFQREVVPG